jgi:hypothetical protein
MPDLVMSGPFALSAFNLLVVRHGPGNYALGRVESDNRFYVYYIGRSDDDLSSRLQSHLGSYPSFMYSAATSPSEAYYKECKNYHDFGGSSKLANKIHPDKPDGTHLSCHICETATMSMLMQALMSARTQGRS